MASETSTAKATTPYLSRSPFCLGGPRPASNASSGPLHPCYLIATSSPPRPSARVPLSSSFARQNPTTSRPATYTFKPSDRPSLVGRRHKCAPPRNPPADVAFAAHGTPRRRESRPGLLPCVGQRLTVLRLARHFHLPLPFSYHLICFRLTALHFSVTLSVLALPPDRS